VFILNFKHHRSVFGDAGALDDLVGVEDEAFGVPMFLPWQTVAVK